MEREREREDKHISCVLQSLVTTFIIIYYNIHYTRERGSSRFDGSTASKKEGERGRERERERERDREIVSLYISFIFQH